MSGGAALIVVLSVVGYVLLRYCCHRTSFRWDALEWQQNIFESTAVGLALFGVIRLITPSLRQLFGSWGPLFESLPTFLNRELSAPFAGSVIAALLLGSLVATIINAIWPKQRAQALAIAAHGGSLRSLLMDAHLTRRAVMLTLSTRKVYVGWVFSPPLLRRPTYLVIFPTLSGYRSNDDLAISWTTDYAPVYLDLTSRADGGEQLKTEPSHFQLVLPLDSVASATFFDKELYDRHFAPRSAAGPDLNDPPTVPSSLPA